MQQKLWRWMPIHLLQLPHQQHQGLSQHSHQQPTTISRQPLLHSPQHSPMHPLPQLRQCPAARLTRACSLPGPQQALLHQLQPFEWASAASLQEMSWTAGQSPMPPMDSQEPLLRVLTDPCTCSGDNRPSQMLPQIPSRPFSMSVPKLMWADAGSCRQSQAHLIGEKTILLASS